MAIPPLITIDVLEEILTVVGALALPIVGKALGLQPFFDALRFVRERRKPRATTEQLAARLSKARSEMDSVIKELQIVADERLTKVTTLESSIHELIVKEQSLRERVRGTEGISTATVELFTGIVEKQLDKAERPKRRRDYMLFAAGVLVSFAVGIGVEAAKPFWLKALHLQEQATAVHQNEPKTQGTKTSH